MGLGLWTQACQLCLAICNMYFLMVADSKWVGPQSKYVKDLKELGKLPNDNSVLPRGSKFLDRMFIKVKKERQSFANLLKGDLSIPEFLNEDISSDNGRMVTDLILRIQTDEGEIPEQYLQFLKDITKTSPSNKPGVFEHP